MKERPILFQGDMVRAILAGRKTQTRRVCRHQYWSHSELHDVNKEGFLCKADRNVTCPYAHKIGDRLWVKETFAEVGTVDPGYLIYRANYPACVPAHLENVPPIDQVRWTPSIFCTRKASRITLEVTSVRVERLQDISEVDAKAEGAKRMQVEAGGVFFSSAPETVSFSGLPKYPSCVGAVPHGTYRDGYWYLWNTINSKRGFSWETNPWVWAITWKQIP